jgi:hypothetical protein
MPGKDVVYFGENCAADAAEADRQWHRYVYIFGLLE